MVNPRVAPATARWPPASLPFPSRDPGVPPWVWGEGSGRSVAFFPYFVSGGGVRSCGVMR